MSSHESIRELFARDDLADRQCDGPGMDRNMNKNMGLYSCIFSFDILTLLNATAIGIIFSSGRVWKDLRRFTIRNLRDFGFGKTNSMEIVQQEELNEFIKYLKTKIGPSGSEIFPVKGLFNLPVLNIVWNLIMSERFSYDDPKLNHYVQLNEEFFMSQNFVSSWSLFFPFLRDWFPERSGRNAVLRSVDGLQDFLKVNFNHIYIVFYRVSVRWAGLPDSYEKMPLHVNYMNYLLYFYSIFRE